jgi:hypothetical protein
MEQENCREVRCFFRLSDLVRDPIVRRVGRVLEASLGWKAGSAETRGDRLRFNTMTYGFDGLAQLMMRR